MHQVADVDMSQAVAGNQEKTREQEHDHRAGVVKWRTVVCASVARVGNLYHRQLSYVLNGGVIATMRGKPAQILSAMFLGGNDAVGLGVNRGLRCSGIDVLNVMGGHGIQFFGST